MISILSPFRHRCPRKPHRGRLGRIMIVLAVALANHWAKPTTNTRPNLHIILISLILETLVQMLLKRLKCCWRCLLVLVTSYLLFSWTIFLFCLCWRVMGSGGGGCEDVWNRKLALGSIVGCCGLLRRRHRCKKVRLIMWRLHLVYQLVQYCFLWVPIVYWVVGFHF